MRTLTALWSLLLAIVVVLPASAQDDVTLLQRMFLVKEMKPDVQRVGVIWSKSMAENQTAVADLNRASAASGIKVITAPVADLKDVAPMFRGLVRQHNIDVLLIVEGDGVMDNKVSRGFLIKSATESGIALIAPKNDWVQEGACATFKKEADGIHLVVNKKAAEALSLTIPEKYLERTQFLALN